MYKCSYDKALPKLPYLPSVFVFFINVGQFVIVEKGTFFLFVCLFFLMPVSLSQYGGTVGMFNNIFISLQTKGAIKIVSVTVEKCNRVNLV